MGTSCGNSWGKTSRRKQISINTATNTIKIVANRNKNIFKSSKSLKKLVESIRSKFGDNINKLTANAKNLDETSQEYDLLAYNFTKTVSLNGKDHDALTDETFKTALRDTYYSNKEELMSYVR